MIITHQNSSYEEVRYLLKHARGVPEENLFNKISGKPIWRMVEEIGERDVTLRMTLRDHAVLYRRSGRFNMFAEGMRWHEIVRIFHNNGEIVPQRKEHALSESMKPGESLFLTLLRVLAEEAGYYVTDGFPLLDDKPAIPKRWSIHRSSVYPGVIAETQIETHDIFLPKAIFSTTQPTFIEDRGTTVVVEPVRSLSPGVAERAIQRLKKDHGALTPG